MRVLPYVAAASAIVFWVLFLVADTPPWLLVLLWVPMMSWYVARIVERRSRES